MAAADTPVASVDPSELRRCLGSFVTGVTVVTALDDDGQPLGMTVNSFSSVSLDPPLVLWSLRNQAGSYLAFSRARRFAINILAEDQVAVSQRFAAPGADRFAGVPWTPGRDGVPLIDGCAAQLDCRTEVTYPGGDHLLFIGRVEGLAHLARRPLAFGAGRYMVVHPHDPLAAAPGEGIVASLAAVQAARPCLETLNRDTGRSVGLSVWGNHGPTLIWWVEGRQTMDVQLRCGMVLPLLGSATGQVFAAFAPPEATARWLDAEIAERSCQPGLTLSTRSEVDAHLNQVRRAKLAAVHDTVIADFNERGVSGVSAPVFDASGAIVLALTMMGDARSFNADDAAVPQLVEAARSLSARLGHAQSSLQSTL